MILRHQIKPLDAMNNFSLWMTRLLVMSLELQMLRQLKVVDDMNKLGSCARDFKCDEQLRVVNDMNDSW